LPEKGIRKVNLKDLLICSLNRFPKAKGIAGGLVGGLAYMFLSGMTCLLLLCIPVRNMSGLAWNYLVLVAGINVALTFLHRVNREILVFEGEN